MYPDKQIAIANAGATPCWAKRRANEPDLALFGDLVTPGNKIAIAKAGAIELRITLTAGRSDAQT